MASDARVVGGLTLGPLVPILALAPQTPRISPALSSKAVRPAEMEPAWAEPGNLAIPLCPLGAGGEEEAPPRPGPLGVGAGGKGFSEPGAGVSALKGLYGRIAHRMCSLFKFPSLTGSPNLMHSGWITRPCPSWLIHFVWSPAPPPNLGGCLHMSTHWLFFWMRWAAGAGTPAACSAPSTACSGGAPCDSLLFAFCWCPLGLTPVEYRCHFQENLISLAEMHKNDVRSRKLNSL